MRILSENTCWRHELAEWWGKLKNIFCSIEKGHLTFIPFLPLAELSARMFIWNFILNKIIDTFHVTSALISNRQVSFSVLNARCSLFPNPSRKAFCSFNDRSFTLAKFLLEMKRNVIYDRFKRHVKNRLNMKSGIMMSKFRVFFRRIAIQSKNLDNLM